MLNDEVNSISTNNLESLEQQEDKESKPLINVSTHIDDSYVNDDDLKIEIHRKINEIDSKEKFEEIKAELEDRFGRLNEDIVIYMYEEWFEKLAKNLKINKIRQTPNFIEVTLPKEISNNLNGELFFKEVSNLSRMFRFSKKQDNIIITLDIIKLDKHFIYYLIDLMKILQKSIN